MQIDVSRFFIGSEATLGLLSIDGHFECFTLEDPPRPDKVPGRTAIPAGVYQVRHRTWGGFHQRYAEKFPEFHKGMLEICDIPDFTDVLFHIGNTHEDTKGCILVAQAAVHHPLTGGSIQHSTAAYGTFYRKVIDAAVAGELRVKVAALDL